MIDPKEYHSLQKQVDIIKRNENYVSLMEERVKLLNNHTASSPLEENKRKIDLYEAESKLRGSREKLAQKKREYKNLIVTLESILPELESNFDALYDKCSKYPEFNDVISNRSITDKDDRVLIYLDLKQLDEIKSKESGKDDNLRPLLKKEESTVDEATVLD